MEYLQYVGEHTCKLPPKPLDDLFYLVSSNIDAVHFTGEMKVDVAIRKRPLSELTPDKTQVDPNGNGEQRPRRDSPTPITYKLLIDVDKQSFARYLQQVTFYLSIHLLVYVLGKYL